MNALILDFDGLVLDTESTDFESWRVVYEDHGVMLPRAEWVRAIGTDGKAFDPVARLIELTGRALQADVLRNTRRRVRDALVERLEPLPGVVAWLEEARRRGMKSAIASSSPRSWVEEHLERVQLRQYFAELVTAEQVPRVKPDPALYERALAALAVRPNEALAVEDSPHGVAAARAARLVCVAVPGPMTKGCSFAEANLQLGSLSDRTLEDVLGDLFAAV